MQKLDLLIIGGGPIGLACGLQAKLAGLNYLIIEKGALVNSLYNYPANMTFFSTSERLEIGGVPFVSLNAKPTRNEALEYYRRVAESHQLQIRLFETVVSVASENEDFMVETSKGKYLACNIVLATGFFDLPVMLNVPGEDLPKVTHYYKEPHFYYRQKVAVVGANNSAVDAALETWRKGAEVTMIVRESAIGERVKYWARPDIINRIEEGSIKAWFNAHITRIEPHQIAIQTPDGIVTLENDYVIAATGYQPNYDLLELLDIELSNDDRRAPLYNPQTQESSRKGVYLAGVVCGGMETHVWFIENSRVHAERIVGDVVARRRI